VVDHRANCPATVAFAGRMEAHFWPVVARCRPASGLYHPLDPSAARMPRFPRQGRTPAHIAVPRSRHSSVVSWQGKLALRDALKAVELRVVELDRRSS